LRILRRLAPDLRRLGARHGLEDRGAAQRILARNLGQIVEPPEPAGIITACS
jgi:hypothetical protein